MKYFQNISNLWGNVLTALGNTVYISLISIVLGTILGIAMGVVLTYCKKRWQWLFRIYVDIMRGLPVLVTIFVVYYFVNAVLKMFFGVQMEQNTAGAVALTMFAAAQMTELTRGALQAIPKGQIEAGRAIGLTFPQIFFNILLPQAVVQMIPPWINSATEMIKASTLLGMIGVLDLLLVTRQIVAKYGEALVYYLIIGVFYFAINTLIEYAGKKLSKKLEKEQVLTALSQNIQLAAIIQPSSEKKPDKIRKLVDIQANVAAGKGIGYERWAKKFNLKRWSQTLCLLQEKKLLSEDALHQRIAELQTQHDDALAVVKDLDARMVSLKELRGHLVVYRQYKPLAQKLQTVRNPAKFKEQHRAEFAVYEAACAYFKANGLRTLPDLKKLDAEYQTLSSEKNGFYTRYKKAQIELRELRTAQQNVEAFFRKEERSHAVPQQEVK